MIGNKAEWFKSSGAFIIKFQIIGVTFSLAKRNGAIGSYPPEDAQVE